MIKERNKKKHKRKKEPPTKNGLSPARKATIGEVLESLQPEILHKLKNDANK